MSGLSSKARAFLDATRLADEPTAADFERVHGAIGARIAAGAAAGAVVGLSAGAAASTAAAPLANGIANGVASAASVATSAPTAAVSGAVSAAGAAAPLGIPSTLAIGAKVAAWVIAIGMTGSAIGVVAKHAVGTGPAPVASSPPTAVVGVPNLKSNSGASTGATPPVARAEPSPASERASPPIPLDNTQPTPGAQPARTARGTGARAELPAIAPTPLSTHTDESIAPIHPPALDVELALMRQARAELNDGHAAEALASLDEHARRFPNGVLAEDRAAQRVLALCALARPGDAKEQGQRFVSSYPRSPYVTAIRGSCAFVSEQEK